MSGTASVSNQFQNAVTATGLQLDQNYTSLVAYANDPTNRNNFATDSGTTNTVVLSFSPPVLGGYSTGLEITFKAASANTAAVVVNANGLGNASLVNPDGTSLQGGQIQSGGIGKAIYDGTRFVFITGFSTPASAAQVSAAVTLVPYVSPGTMQNHPGVAKAVAAWNGTNTGTITAAFGYNVTNIVRTGLGTYSINLTTAFANTGYAVITGNGLPTTGGFGLCNVLFKGTTAFVVTTIARDMSSNIDMQNMSVSAFGPQ